MSLLEKSRLTEKRLEAMAKNRSRSHGPEAAAGRERIRAAHPRHGICSQDEEAALRLLGEEPARFQEVARGLCDAAAVEDLRGGPERVARKNLCAR